MPVADEPASQHLQNPLSFWKLLESKTSDYEIIHAEPSGAGEKEPEQDDEGRAPREDIKIPRASRAETML
jgi:hypothetical protein